MARPLHAYVRRCNYQQHVSLPDKNTFQRERGQKMKICFLVIYSSIFLPFTSSTSSVSPSLPPSSPLPHPSTSCLSTVFLFLTPLLLHSVLATLSSLLSRWRWNVGMRGELEKGGLGLAVWAHAASQNFDAHTKFVCIGACVCVCKISNDMTQSQV